MRSLNMELLVLIVVGCMAIALYFPCFIVI
uniref:Uncharacterized protein n=1 Tax=Rhizophora mucronata TaxID=61149 RepID=A0A2P2QTC0_RHIMU